MKIKYTSGSNKSSEEAVNGSHVNTSQVIQKVTEHANVYPLVEKIRSDDREAFKTLTSLYQKKVYLLAYSFFRNRDDALDIVQETFLRLYQKADMYKEGHSFQNWLLQIAKNLCIDYYRKHYRHEGETNR
ncbi:MAG: sigma-70 family RNA polymerase sigma factor, partial [Candidatus Aminicenantes bacterium]|nr:sigma-70 family RNA polymerase sigma factor [Candidatus Aminicenantes bacterium]